MTDDRDLRDNVQSFSTLCQEPNEWRLVPSTMQLKLLDERNYLNLEAQ